MMISFLQCDFTFDVIVDGSEFRNLDCIFVSDSHVLGERNAPLLFHQFGRLKSVVEVLLDLTKSCQNSWLIVNGLLTKLRLQLFLFVYLLFSVDCCYHSITVDRNLILLFTCTLLGIRELFRLFNHFTFRIKMTK